MAQSQGRKHGGMRKHGRNKKKCELYQQRKTRERNKLKRVLKSSGIKAAMEYARVNGIPAPKAKPAT